jgi:peptidoglycan/LPS O-acetylase OafA/YrhL
VADRPRLEALSGLRLFAISCIIVRHLGEVPVAEAPRFVQRFFGHSYHFMPLFFVMSGFVLTYRYGDSIRSGKLGARSFWLSRLLRIWPIYLVALALRIAVEVHANGSVAPRNVLGALSHALLIQAWTPPLVWYGNAPGWTVSVEAFLYVLFPWLVVRVFRMTMRRAATLAALLWIVGQLVALLYMVTQPDGWPPQGKPSPFYFDLLRYLPPLHLPSFLVGVVAARLFLEDRASGRRRSGGWLALAGFVPVLFAFGAGVELVAHRIFGFVVWPFPLGHNGMLSPAWGLVLFGLAHGGAPSRWLAVRPLVRLGNASYGLYILHFPVFDAVESLAIRNWDHSRTFLLQIFAVLLPLCVISFERFEEPLRSALLARWDRPRPGPDR